MPALNTFVQAKVLIVNDAGELLLLRRSKTDERRPGDQDLPGGRVEQGEDVFEAVKRESIEETGIKLKDPILIYGITATVGFGNGTWLAFAQRVHGRPKVTLSFEHDEYQWVKVADALTVLTYERQINMVRQLITVGMAGKTV